MNTVLNNFYIDTFDDNKLVKTNKILIIRDTMRLRDKFRKQGVQNLKQVKFLNLTYVGIAYLKRVTSSYE